MGGGRRPPIDSLERPAERVRAPSIDSAQRGSRANTGKPPLRRGTRVVGDEAEWLPEYMIEPMRTSTLALMKRFDARKVA